MTLACFPSCDPIENVISPEDFSKVDQEVLGDRLWQVLVSDASPLDILPTEDHPALYEHIETLYRQSYFIMRATSGWSTSRDWQIAIFQDENESAFALPGGNMLISTGMLKVFQKEYELFYLMTFENSLVDSGFLLSNILTYIEDSIDIKRLINEQDNEKALQIGIEIHEMLTFNPLVVEQIDLTTMHWICQSSNLRTDGIAPFLPRLKDVSIWKRSRMSAINRLSVVVNNFLALDCGNSDRETSLGTDFYVSEILPLIP